MTVARAKFPLKMTQFLNQYISDLKYENQNIISFT
jgi:hypothetical protein